MLFIYGHDATCKLLDILRQVVQTVSIEYHFISEVVDPGRACGPQLTIVVADQRQWFVGETSDK